MKTIYKIGFCLLLISTQASLFAANKTSDKQLLKAYQLLVVNKASKKAPLVKTKAVVNRAHGRTPQVNATLVAKRMLNIKYRWGGTNPKTGFDCSGLMQYAYRASKINIPRTAAEQYKHTKRVSMKNLKVGDLIFFHTRRTKARVNHVGMYVGGGNFIHAPRRGKNVSVSKLSSYWKRKAVGAGRV